MSQETKNPAPAPEQDLSELLQIRRDKLKSLQDEGRDPFRQTRFVRSALRFCRSTIKTGAGI